MTTEPTFGLPAMWIMESYREEAFGFFEVPHKYVDTGVRADRAFPMMMRAAAIVDIPAGKCKISWPDFVDDEWKPV